MNNSLLQLKLQQRVNKLASSDYGDIEPWMMIEAFNKSMDGWVRRQLEGINQTKTGNESSTRRIDDLQVLLTEWTCNFTNKGLYWQSDLFPGNYLEWCRLDIYAQDSCKSCPPRLMTTFLNNEADVVVDLIDTNRQPDYEWSTTFHTIMGNTFKIWTNNSFDVVNPLVLYYRTPVHIQVAGTVDPDTGTTSGLDVECELPDGVTELIIDEAASILARDMDNYTKSQSLTQEAEFNN